jgi:hypothetical protein
MNRTHRDELFGSVLTAPTNISINDEDNLTNIMSKFIFPANRLFISDRTFQEGGAFQLPSIMGQATTKNTSPFQGFLDVSIVNQKLRSTIMSQGSSLESLNNQPFMDRK